jgi:hypothetical protein
MRRTSKLKLDVSSIISRAKALPKAKVESISINIPFISVNLSCSDIEKKVAKEVLIRLRDKRVLDSRNCCDNCAKFQINSLLDIRELLVNKQVELADENSALFLLFDFMLAGIRYFLNLTERNDSFKRAGEYRDTLDTLRDHLLRCINEIAKIGNVKPRLLTQIEFDPAWDKEIYSISKEEKTQGSIEDFRE